MRIVFTFQPLLTLITVGFDCTKRKLTLLRLFLVFTIFSLILVSVVKGWNVRNMMMPSWAFFLHLTTPSTLVCVLNPLCSKRPHPPASFVCVCIESGRLSGLSSLAVVKMKIRLCIDYSYLGKATFQMKSNPSRLIRRKFQFLCFTDSFKALALWRLIHSAVYLSPFNMQKYDTKLTFSRETRF